MSPGGEFGGGVRLTGSNPQKVPQSPPGGGISAGWLDARPPDYHWLGRVAGNSRIGKVGATLCPLRRRDSRIDLTRRQCPNAEMPKVYQAVSLLAVPSVSYETGPFVVREALARGIPVAASGTIGDPELVRRAGGWILAKNSVQEWRELLASCLAKFQAGQWRPGRPVNVPTSAEMYAAIVESYAAALRN